MASFEIVVEDVTLKATLHGYWDIATARRYATELSRRAAADGHRVHRWLIVLIDFPVQSREVAEVIKHAVEAAARIAPPPRIAVVGGSALGTLQANRVAPQTGHRSFKAIADAEAWLADDAAS